MHENGRRGIPKAKAPTYARRFRTTVDWLLYGKGPRTTGEALPTPAELATMLADAQAEVVTIGTTLAEWPRLVASALHERLERFQEFGRAAPDRDPAPEISLGKGVQSPPPTRPNAAE